MTTLAIFYFIKIVYPLDLDPDLDPETDPQILDPNNNIDGSTSSAVIEKTPAMTQFSWHGSVCYRKYFLVLYLVGASLYTRERMKITLVAKFVPKLKKKIFVWFLVKKLYIFHRAMPHCNTSEHFWSGNNVEHINFCDEYWPKTGQRLNMRDLYRRILHFALYMGVHVVLAFWVFFSPRLCLILGIQSCFGVPYSNNIEEKRMRPKKESYMNYRTQ